MVAHLAAVSVLALATLAAAKSSSSSVKASKSSSHSASATITKAAVAASKVANAAASSSPLPLTDYTYAYSDVPYQVNPYAVGRGPQSGYNMCNSTTAGDDSECQTLIMNSISDFCLWGSATADGTIGDVEAAVVAYCTESDAHGARTFPAGTITGIQWIRTSAYIQITGFLDQTKLGLTSDDTGGELDPHGADNLGNPLGGLVYSNSLYSDSNGTADSDYTQVMNWNNFIGSNTFCMKLCYNNVTSPDYCQNKFDLIGCSYNMPSANVDGEFLKCDGDLQDEAGTYTGTNGKTTVWSQPESLSDGYTMPYTPRVPASSNCQTFSSDELFGAAAATSAATSASATSATDSASDSSATSSLASSTATATAETGSTATATASSTASATDSATSATETATETSDSSSAPLSTATGTASSAAASAATTSSTTSDAMRLVVGSGLIGAAVLGAVALLI